MEGQRCKYEAKSEMPQRWRWGFVKRNATEETVYKVKADADGDR